MNVLQAHGSMTPAQRAQRVRLEAELTDGVRTGNPSLAEDTGQHRRRLCSALCHVQKGQADAHSM